MLIDHLSDLVPVRQRAIIINHNTKKLTTLTLLSAIRYAKIPVLLIDCESTDGSFVLFNSLMQQYEFDLLRAPLLTHGKTLDHLFKLIRDEYVLLLDSDLEILDSRACEFVNNSIIGKNVFGSGFLINHTIINEPHFKGKSLEGALYFERPFMPFVLFKTSHIKMALNAGISFQEEIWNNEFSLLPKKVYWQAKKIFGSGFRKRFFNAYPPKVVYDTGARMYEYLALKKSRTFIGIPFNEHESYVTHYHGATRRVLNPDGNLVGDYVKSGKVEDIIEGRLRDVYGVDVIF